MVAQTSDLVNEFLRESEAAGRRRLWRRWAIIVSVLAVITALALLAFWFAIQTKQQASELEAAATTDAQLFLIN